MENCWQITELGYVYQLDNELAEESKRSLLYELENLFIENKADKSGDSYILHHPVAAALSADEREILHLPTIFPYVISIKNKGNMATSRFHYVLSFLQRQDMPFVNPEIIGSYIKISPEVDYIFNKDQYDIVSTVQNCNEKVKKLNRLDALMFNGENLAKIKSIVANVDTTLSKYLKEQDIVVPDKLSVQVEQNQNGDYVVQPILLTEKENEFEVIRNTKSFTDAFSRQNLANSTYLGSDRKIYIMKPRVKEGLQEIKDKEIIKKTEKEKVERLKKQPKELFMSPVFEFDLSDYGERVVSIGEFVQKSLPYLKSTEGSWLPEEGSAFLDDPEQPENSLPPLNKDNIDEIIGKIKQAQENNQTKILYEGKMYPITPKLMQRAFEIYISCHPGSKGENKENNSGEKVKHKALNIKDNIEQLEYEARKKVSAVFSENIFSGLKADITLYDHQKQGVQWIFECWRKGYHGVLLADDMGLGKTMQAYTFISGLKLSSPNQSMQSVLVVAPVSLLKNWEEEFKKFIRPNLFEDIVELYGGEIHRYTANGYIDLTPLTNNQLVLTTYETLRDYQLSIGKIKWSVMVLDEAQKIKNPTTMVTNAVKAMQYDFGIALTGTPVENTWNDLWSIMDFAAPGRLGSLKEFNQKYQSKIKNVQHNKEALNSLGEQLQQDLQPIFMRRLKKDILDGLPKKRIIKLEEPMPEIQRKAYEDIIIKARNERDTMVKGQMLKVIAQLRDVSLCPYIDIYKDTAFIQQGAKAVIQSSARLIETFAALDAIRERKEKVLLFVTSRKMQRIIQSIIEVKYGIHLLPAINGAMQSERRQEVVSSFSESTGFNILLLSVEAGGVGFNIIAANNVIHLSRCWNPAKEDQATDRVYRIGQKKDVNVYLPMAYDPNFAKDLSFDEKLDHLLDYKRNLSDSVLYPTGDSSDDGRNMFVDIIDNGPKDAIKENVSTYGNKYWQIDDLAEIEGIAFERIVGRVLRQINGYNIEITPPSNDKGADIVMKKSAEKTGILVQCKQTSTERNMTQAGVIEVYGAIPYYSKLYGITFEGVVITNAKGFTTNAKKMAALNHIKLIAYDGLAELLKKYPVKKSGGLA